MAHYRIQMKVDMPEEQLFTYLATLTNAKDWEPGVSGANVSDGAPLGIGSTFELEMHSRTRSRPFVYKIVEFEPPHHCVLEAVTRAFYSRITIDTRSIDDETSELNYESALRRRGFAAFFNGLLYLPVRRTGKRAQQNLAKVLTRH